MPVLLVYSGGRYQKDLGSKPAHANSSQYLIWKIPITKKGLVEWLNVKTLSSNPSTTKKKKKYVLLLNYTTVPRTQLLKQDCRDWSVHQVELLPTMCMTLGLILSTVKKKKKI
jgi:hypothetical protein